MNVTLLPHPLVGLALRLKARELEKPEDGFAVRHALRHHSRSWLFDEIDDIAGEKLDGDTLTALQAPVTDANRGGLLELLFKFLDAHWADIWAAILKLLGK